jgi:Galactose mutarotase and related enzymes
MAAEIVTLSDPHAGSSAQIAVNLGFNCFRLTVQNGDQPVEVLYTHPEFVSGNQRPSGSGIPILFPFPGRIRGTTFSWEGKHYQLEAGDALGNAIHGFAMRRPWRVVKQGADHVVGEFHAWRDDPSLKDRWPADFRITATYKLSQNRLDGTYRIDNPCDVPLPFGFGTHPYFRVPLGGPSADTCIVWLPVTERWVLKDMLPTGKRRPLSDTEAFDSGCRLGELKLDDVFTGLTDIAGVTEASIQDPGGMAVAIRWNVEQFRECVVYTPPHREAICIEPLTCAPGAAALAARGIDAGWRVLPPGKSFEATVTIEATA